MASFGDNGNVQEQGATSPGKIEQQVPNVPPRRISLSPLLPVHHPNMPRGGGGASVHGRNWFWPWNMHHAFLHATDLFPYQEVANNPDLVRPLPQDDDDDADPMDLAALSYAGASGKAERLSSLLERRDTDAFLVVHRGKLVFQHLAHDVTGTSAHWTLSMCRSVVGVLAGQLAAAGALDLEGPVETFVPELANTQYKGATVRQLLDMRSGVKSSHILRIMVEAGLLSFPWIRRREERPTRSIHEHILGWARQRRPADGTLLSSSTTTGKRGGPFVYSCLDTEVLGWVCERAAGGRPLAQLVSELVWIPMGAEMPGSWLVDRTGGALYGSGLCACARDLARFGLALAEDGRAAGAWSSSWSSSSSSGRRSASPVAAGWRADATRPDAGGARGAFCGSFFGVPARGGQYRSHMWVMAVAGEENGEEVGADPGGGAALCYGAFGQFVHVDGSGETVCVVLSSWRRPADAVVAGRWLRAFAAVGQQVRAVDLLNDAPDT